MYKLAIFDFDGTLADSAAWFARTLNEIAQRHGFRQVGPTEIEALRGRTSRQILADLGVARWRLPFIATDMRRRMARDAVSILLFPGAQAMLDRVAASGVRIAVVSSNSEANVRRILGPAATPRVSDYDCGTGLFGKARRFRRVIARSGFAPAQTLCIGDELRDLEAAQAVGAASAAVLWGYATADSLARARPTLTFRRMDEIAARLAGPRPVAETAG